MNERIPALSIALTTEGLIELEQQNGLDEPDRIEIHPLHVRLMAERLGLVREMSACDADGLRITQRPACVPRDNTGQSKGQLELGVAA